MLKAEFEAQLEIWVRCADSLEEKDLNSELIVSFSSPSFYITGLDWSIFLEMGWGGTSQNRY